MAKIALQKVDKSGDPKSDTNASVGGDSFDSFKGVFVTIRNGNAVSTRTVTIVAINNPIDNADAGSLAVPDIVIVIPTLDFLLFSVPASHINANGLVTMTYDNEADVALAVCYVAQ